MREFARKDLKPRLWTKSSQAWLEPIHVFENTTIESSARQMSCLATLHSRRGAMFYSLHCFSFCRVSTTQKRVVTTLVQTLNRRITIVFTMDKAVSAATRILVTLESVDRNFPNSKAKKETTLNATNTNDTSEAN